MASFHAGSFKALSFYFSVSYEELVDDPSGTMDKIFAFLGVAPVPVYSEL